MSTLVHRWVSAVNTGRNYETQIVADNHQFVADEPIEMGGTDLGADPGDFLIASLASCTAITLRMYANRKNYNIRRIEVKVRSERLKDKTIFYSEVIIDGDVDEGQRNRMLQIAKACPIHKVLSHPIEIETQLH